MSTTREKAPLTIQTLELDPSLGATSGYSIEANPRIRRARQPRPRRLVQVQETEQTSSDSSDHHNNFLFYEMFDPKKLTLAEIKRKYRTNKNKADLSQMLTTNDMFGQADMQAAFYVI